MFRVDPGECPICGAAHTSCAKDTTAPIAIAQLPMRDAGMAPEVAAPPVVAELQADIVQRTLPNGQFTSGSYRRPKGGA